MYRTCMTIASAALRLTLYNYQPKNQFYSIYMQLVSLSTVAQFLLNYRYFYPSNQIFNDQLAEPESNYIQVL